MERSRPKFWVKVNMRQSGGSRLRSLKAGIAMYRARTAK